jgi:hydrogenase 3 maturation protease
VAFSLVANKIVLEKELSEWFGGTMRIVIAGIGNPLRRDDFAGVKIVQGLEGKLPEWVYLLECETVPESFLNAIVDFNPTHVLLIDVAFLGLKPGEVRLVVQEQIADFPAISTHALPMRIFCEYITATTKSKIALLLIEPENVEFGEGLTPEIQRTAETLTNTLLKLLS